MIGKLTGVIDSLNEDGLLLDVNGVGYVVHASSKTIARLGAAGTSASILVETQVREDAITLFGFADHAERDWFRLLRSVQGVGGKVALAILSTLTPNDLIHAVASQDKASVARANGVGPKLAQRIVTELKDKAAGLELGAGANVVPIPAGKAGEGADVINDAVETLTEAEIARAKAQMKAGLLMALESCSARAEQLARHILAYGRPQTVPELMARIDAVSVESTRNAARALLSRSRPAVAALGSGRGLDTAVAFAEGLTRSKAKIHLH